MRGGRHALGGDKPESRPFWQERRRFERRRCGDTEGTEQQRGRITERGKGEVKRD